MNDSLFNSSSVTKHALVNPYDGSDSLCGTGCYLTMNYEDVDCPNCRELMKGTRFASSVAATDSLQASAEDRKSVV